MSKSDKSFPLLILPLLSSLHNPRVGSYEFRSSGCPHSLKWLSFLENMLLAPFYLTHIL
jgi:hypothetical protein